MDDDAGALFDHRRQQRAIEAHGSEKVLVERLVPFLSSSTAKPPGRRGRAADDMHDDVDAAETVADRVRDGGASFRRRDIGDNEVPGVGKTSGRDRAVVKASRRPRAAPRRRPDHALGAARHERALALKSEIAAHDLISSAAILPPSSVNTKSSVTGLPGKLPVSFVLTRSCRARDAAIGSRCAGISLRFEPPRFDGLKALQRLAFVLYRGVHAKHSASASSVVRVFG